MNTTYPPPMPPAMHIQPEPAHTASSHRPAGCLVRMIALLVDIALLAVLLVVVKLVLGQIFEFQLQGMVLDPSGHTFDRLTKRYDLIWMAFAMMLPVAYVTLAEMTGRAATFGKRLVGLKVVSTGGTRAGPLRAVARNLAKVISAAPCFVGFAIAIFPGKRALHDLLTGSRVVHRSKK